MQFKEVIGLAVLLNYLGAGPCPDKEIGMKLGLAWRMIYLGTGLCPDMNIYAEFGLAWLMKYLEKAGLSSMDMFYQGTGCNPDRNYLNEIGLAWPMQLLLNIAEAIQVVECTRACGLWDQWNTLPGNCQTSSTSFASCWKLTNS